MRIYQADLSLALILKYYELFPDRKLNVLRSFGGLDLDEYGICATHRDKLNSVILDSGTYTMNYAKTQGMNISIDTYESYLLAFGKDYDFYFNFDSDFSKQGFHVNDEHQRRLEDAGLTPVPVVRDIYGDEVKYFIDKGYKLVAIGSQWRGINDLYMVTDRFHQVGVDVHLFGTARYDYLVNLPIFSCDTTTWAKAGAYGMILYWNPEKRDVNKTDQIYVEEYLHADDKKTMSFSTYEFRDDLEEYLHQTLMISHNDFYGVNGAFFKQLVNLDYMVCLEERINALKDTINKPKP